MNTEKQAKDFSRTRSRYKVRRTALGSGKLLFFSVFALIIACGIGLGFSWYMGIGLFSPYLMGDARVISLKSVSVDSEISETVEFTFTADTIANIYNSENISAFSMSTLSQPDITTTEMQAITDAYETIKDSGKAGFLIVNMSTGRGISCNIDDSVYAEGSIIAPYCTYLCEQLIDTNNEKNNKVYFSELQERMTKAITSSDTESFTSLKTTYDALGWNDFLSSLNASECISNTTNYVSYSTRTSLKLWFHINEYLNLAATNSNADFLSKQLQATTVSFIRSALGQNSGAIVWDKAGYYSSENEQAYCICDTGIVELDGTKYLISVMTGLQWTDANVAQVQSLISSLFNAKDELSLQKLTKTEITNANGTVRVIYKNKNGTEVKLQ